MNPHEAIIQKLAALRSVLPSGADIGKVGFAIYARGLEDVPPDALDAALGRAVKECRYFPTVEEIRALAGCQGPQTRSELGRSAWAAVLECVTTGKWADLDAPTKAALRVLGGSWNVRQADERGLGLLRTRFLDVYRAPEEARPALPEGEGPDKARVMRLVRDISGKK